jgi:hypothetical protein
MKWNPFSKKNHYYLFYFILTLKFPSFSHPPKTALSLSLSLSHTHTTGSSFSGEDPCRRPSGPSLLGHYAEAPPFSLSQQDHPSSVKILVAGLDLTHQSDTNANLDLTHQATQTTSSSPRSCSSCRGWPANQWGCQAPL